MQDFYGNFRISLFWENEPINKPVNLVLEILKNNPSILKTLDNPQIFSYISSAQKSKFKLHNFSAIFACLQKGVTMNNRYKKSIDELTICDNFMFVKVFSDKEIAKPFLKALLKVDIEDVEVVGESFQQTDPNKKFVRFDVMVKDSQNSGIGRVFDLEMQMVDTKDLPLRSRYYQGICDTETLGSSHKYNELKEQYIIFLCPEDIFGGNRAIYEFENREKNDPTILLGDLTYKIFCNFSKYTAVNDESIRDYLKYFATGKVTTEATREIQNKVEFYHKDPKTRSDYMTFKDLLEDEREEGRKEGRKEGLLTKAREIAKAMLLKRMPVSMISEISGLSESEIKSL